MLTYKVYVAHIAPNSVEDNTHNNQLDFNHIHFDPWIIGAAALGVGVVAIGAFILRFSNAEIFNKSSKNIRIEARANASLTDNPIEVQESEPFTDLSNTISDIARKGIDNTTGYNKELLSIVRESISSAQLSAESRNCLVKATENLVEAQKGTIEATKNIVAGMDKLAQAQEVAKKEILESHEIAVTEFKTTCDRLNKQLIRTESTVKNEFAAAIAQLRIDIQESEKKVIAAIKVQ